MPAFEDSRAADQEISLLIRAKFPLVSVVTYEEHFFLTQMLQTRRDVIAGREEFLRRQLARPDHPEREELQRQLERLPDAYQVICWSCTIGLWHWSRYEKTEGGGQRWAPRKLALGLNDDCNPVEVLRFLNQDLQVREGVDLGTALFVFCDLHPWLDREDRMGRFNHMLVRTLRDLAQRIRFSHQPRSILLLSPRSVVPLELNKDIHVIDYPLPTVEQLEGHFHAREPQIRHRYGDDSIRLSDDERKALMRALAGLTYDEAENVLAKSLVNNGVLGKDDIQEALREKRQIIEKDGILEYFDSSTQVEDIGGLELLLRWLGQRRQAFEGRTRTCDGVVIHLPIPKGILLIGVPGGGKSLVAKSIGMAWELPLLRLDVGRIFGGIVGESEANMRRAIAVAESIAPTVVWLDEVEKAFPKVTGSTDSGVSLRVMNTFLTWMQEKRKPVFVVATGNDISQVPAELTRKGRFDEIFYVGLPDCAARRKIWEIHTRGLPLADVDHEELARKTMLYTGAEIEQLVKNALFLVPDDGNGAGQPPLGGVVPRPSAAGGAARSPLRMALEACVANFVPLARRRGPDGHGLLTKTLEQARQIAVPASEKFEDLPSELAAGAQAGAAYFGRDERF